MGFLGAGEGGGGVTGAREERYLTHTGIYAHVAGETGHEPGLLPFLS